MKDNKKNSNKVKGGYLFIASGIAFIASAMLSEQVYFSGVGIAFICIGAAFISKNKKQS